MVSFFTSIYQCFKVDEATCTFGTITAKGEYKPRSNFTIQLVTYVEAGESTGYFARVKRKTDGLTRYVLGSSRYTICPVP